MVGVVVVDGGDAEDGVDGDDVCSSCSRLWYGPHSLRRRAGRSGAHRRCAGGRLTTAVTRYEVGVPTRHLDIVGVPSRRVAEGRPVGGGVAPPSTID